MLLSLNLDLFIYSLVLSIIIDMAHGSIAMLCMGEYYCINRKSPD